MDEQTAQQPTPPAPSTTAEPTSPVTASPETAVDGVPDGLPPGTTFVRVVRGPRRWPGILACVLAVLMLVATGVAIELSAQYDFGSATVVAYLAIGLSVAAVVAGIIAIVGRWARIAGLVGLIVGVLGNPLVLNYGLNYLSGR